MKIVGPASLRVFQRATEVPFRIVVDQWYRDLTDSQAGPLCSYPQLQRQPVACFRQLEPANRRGSIGFEPAERIRQADTQEPVEDGGDLLVYRDSFRGRRHGTEVQGQQVPGPADDIRVVSPHLTKEVRYVGGLVLMVAVHGDYPFEAMGPSVGERINQTSAIAGIHVVRNQAETGVFFERPAGAIRAAVVHHQYVSRISLHGP